MRLRILISGIAGLIVGYIVGYNLYSILGIPGTIVAVFACSFCLDIAIEHIHR